MGWEVGGGGMCVCVCVGGGGGGGTSLQITSTNVHRSEYDAFNNHNQIKTVNNEHSQYL